MACPIAIWWHHQMETFSALLALCAGNSPVPDEFPAQRPVTWSFDVFFDLCLNKRSSKQSWGWWFQTPSCSLWCHCNDQEAITWAKAGLLWGTPKGNFHLKLNANIFLQENWFEYMVTAKCQPFHCLYRVPSLSTLVQIMVCHLIRATLSSWTSVGILFIGPSGTIFSENLIKMKWFSFKKMKFNIYCLENDSHFVSASVSSMAVLSQCQMLAC